MIHIPHPPFKAVVGSRSPKMMLIGEAWGENEDAYKEPFVGESGKELFRMLGEAMPDIAPELHARICEDMKYGFAWIRTRGEWLEEANICFTNVLAFRPPDNKIEALCTTKKELGDGYLLPPITKGKYLRPDYFGELERLEIEIRDLAPNLLVALGNTSCWALLRATNIGSIRGAIARSAADTPGNGRKVLPTYHPAGVLRNWSWRTIVIADLMKARRECEYPDIRRPERRILIEPTISEIKAFFQGIHRESLVRAEPILLGADTETEAGQITCISFSPSAGGGIVIPIWDKRKPGWSAWTQEEEEEIWTLIEAFIEAPWVKLLWQNGMYDYQYMTPMKLKIGNSTEDTMLLHHSLYPELQKGLGFLGSLYTNEASWKLMRRRKADTEKRDE